MNKEYKNIDDLFRDKFDNYEVDPPEHVWENVKSGINKKGGQGSGGFKNGGIAGISALIIGTALIAFYLLNNSFIFTGNQDQSLNQDQQIVNNSNKIIADNQSLIPNNSQNINNTGYSDSHRDNQKEGKKKDKKSKKQKKKSNPDKNSSFTLNPVMEPEIDKSARGKVNLAVQPFKDINLAVIRSQEAIIQRDLYSLSTAEKPSENVDIPSDQEPEAPKNIIRGQYGNNSGNYDEGENKKPYRKTSPWILGAYFTPELIYYPSDDHLKNYSYSIDLNLTYRFSNYFIQSGLGVSRLHDKGNNIVEYNKFLGTYEDVYHITFDTLAGELIPVYHTETVNVYDSINYTTVTSTKRYFTYLQIPVFIGYGNQSKRFGWHIKGGPSVSFLLDKKLPDSDLENQVRILNINNELPGRTNLSVQFILSAGVSYKLGDRLSLGLEPMFRYYFDSTYEKNQLNTKHPYSIGLRTGIIYNF